MRNWWRSLEYARFTFGRGLKTKFVTVLVPAKLTSPAVSLLTVTQEVVAMFARAKVDELAKRFHQPRAAVVCYIMHWGLSHEQTGTRDGEASEGPVRHLSRSVDTALHARVENAAMAAGVKIAPWLRHMVRQVTIADFPPAGR
jgi:hypothetical protein